MPGSKFVKIFTVKYRNTVAYFYFRRLRFVTINNVIICKKFRNYEKRQTKKQG